MQILRRITNSAQIQTCLARILPSKSIRNPRFRFLSAKSAGGDDWNDAWETAWLPDDLSGKDSVPWESDVNFGISSGEGNVVLPAKTDAETKAFVEEMNENWEGRRKGKLKKIGEEDGKNMKEDEGLYSLENIRKDYRLKKQRVHAGLWMKEIEKLEEAKLGTDGLGGAGDDIEKMLDSCSEIFDSPHADMSDSKVPSASEFKNKPDGWETMSKEQDGNVWDMTQREEDILLQEFERRMAFCKYQIASFIKTHIFSRRRPIDGWKYMIEEIGQDRMPGKGRAALQSCRALLIQQLSLSKRMIQPLLVATPTSEADKDLPILI